MHLKANIYFFVVAADKLTMESLTPSDPEQRGAQLSIRFSKHVKQMFDEVSKRGVIVSLYNLFLFTIKIKLA